MSGSCAVLVVRVRHCLSVLVYAGLSIVYCCRALPVTGCTCFYAYNLANCFCKNFFRGRWTFNCYLCISYIEAELSNGHVDSVGFFCEGSPVLLTSSKLTAYLANRMVFLLSFFISKFLCEDACPSNPTCVCEQCVSVVWVRIPQYRVFHEWFF